MDINEFKLDLQAVLDKIKSIANIKNDIKIIEAKLPKIKLQGTLNSSATKKELNSKLKSINSKVKIDADVTVADKKIKKLGQQKASPTITPKVDNSQVVSGLKQAQKETKTLWDRFTNGIMGINLIRMGIQEVTRAIRQAIAEIKELDAIKTNIQMVSGASNSGVTVMMGSYNKMAKDLSSTTKEVGEAANEFLRMGESISSTNELIKSSQVLSKVGMIESADSASYLISSLKGYKIAAENSMDVVSKLTSVDMEAAVSAGGLAEALSKCSNIANNSGVTMDRLIGYVATIGEVTQKSMSEVGNSVQSMLSRMNNIKIGRFIDDETGESLSDTEAVLNKLGIKLRDTEDSYRSFNDVLDDVGSRWSKFNKVEQNAISVAIAGTRQRENFEALMNNWGNALKYSETAANSAGSALARYGVYQDSIQAKTNELTAAIELLSTNIVSEELYSGIIEATTNVVELIDKTNLLKGTLAGLVTMGISKAFVSMATGIIVASKSTAQLTTAMALFDKGRSIQNLKDIGAACKGLSDQQLKLILSTKGLTDAQRKSILTGMGVTETEQQQTLATLGFANAENVATASTFSFKGALNSLMTAISMNPIGAIATAVSAVTIAFSVYKQHQEEVKQATEEAANAYKESASAIDDYASRYQELHKALLEAKGDEQETYNIKKQLLSLQTELNDKYADEHGAIDLVTDSYRDQIEVIKALNKEKAQTFLNENKEGIDKASKEMVKARHYNLSYTGMSSNTDDGAALKEIAEKYKDQGLYLLDELGDGSYAQFSIHLNADVQSAYDTINAFENDVRVKAKELGDEHIFDDVLEISSSELNRAKETIDNYSEIYKQALTAEIVSDDSKAKTYSEALQVVEAYNEAVLKSENPYDDQNVIQAKENLDKIKESIQGNEEELGKYSILFDEVFNQANIRLIEFNEAIKNDSGLQELAKDLEGFSDLDLRALNENVGGNDSFDKLKKAAEEYELNVEELINALIRLGYIQGEIQSSISNTIPPIQFNPTDFSKYTEALSSLQSTYNDFYEKSKKGVSFVFDISDIEKLREEFGETCNSFEEFEALATNSGTSVIEMQDAFDKLATEYIFGTNMLNGLNESTREQILTQLELQGIVGANSIITEEFAQAVSDASEKGIDFANSTYEEINAFIQEGAYLEETQQKLYAYAIQKMLANENCLNTTGDIEALKNLCVNLGIATESLIWFARAKALQEQIDSGVDSALVVQQLNTAKDKCKELAAQVSVTAGGFTNMGKAASNASKSGSKGADKWKDKLSDLGNIINYIGKIIGNQIDKFNKQKDAAVDALTAQKEAAENALKAEKALVQEKIDAKQAEIDAIEDAANSRKRELDLQRAQYELEKMQNMRTKLVK